MLSLVDPDNRRPVDWTDRGERLDRVLADEPAFDLDDEKLRVTARTLGVRRDLPGVFVGEGTTYAGLPTTSEHALAFGRGDADGARVVTVATRAAGLLAEAGGLRRRHRRRCPPARGTTCCPTTRRCTTAVTCCLADPAGPPPGRAAREAVVTRTGPLGLGAARGVRRGRVECRRPGRPTRVDRAGRRDRARRPDDAPTGDGWWRWEPATDAAVTRRHPGGRHRLRLRARRCRAGRCPTRAARGSRTACTARAAPSTRARFALDRRRLARTAFGRRGARARSSTSCTSAPSRRRAPSTPPSARLDHLVALGVDVVELMPVGGLPGAVGLGLRRCRPLGRARRLRRPGRAAAVRRRLPRPRASASPSTSCTTTSAPAATTSRGSGPTSPRRTTPRGGRRSTSTTRARPRCGGSSSRASLRWFRDFHVDALRLDAVHELKDDSAAALPRRALRRRGRPVDRARPPARPRRRERPQRHRRW